MAAGDRRVCPLCEKEVAYLDRHLLAPTVHTNLEVAALAALLPAVDGLDFSDIARRRVDGLE